MGRPFAERALDAAIDIGTIIGTSVGAASSVIARLRGDGPSGEQDDDQSFEDVDDTELWGEANLLFRPLDPTNEGACEAVFIRRGDTRELIGFRDRRWQITLEQGEAVLRNLSADASKRASIKLNQNGEAIIDAVKVYVGDEGATEKIALGTTLKSFLDGVKTFLDLVKTHTHPVSGATAGPSVALSGGAPSVPTIESRHVVEGA